MKCIKCGSKFENLVKACCDNPSCFLVSLHEIQLVKKYPKYCPKCRIVVDRIFELELVE